MEKELNQYLKKNWGKWSSLFMRYQYLFYSKGSYYTIIVGRSPLLTHWTASIGYLNTKPHVDYGYTVMESLNYESEDLEEMKKTTLRYIREHFRPSSPWKRV